MDRCTWELPWLPVPECQVLWLFWAFGARTGELLHEEGRIRRQSFPVFYPTNSSWFLIVSILFVLTRELWPGMFQHLCLVHLGTPCCMRFSFSLTFHLIRCVHSLFPSLGTSQSDLGCWRWLRRCCWSLPCWTLCGRTCTAPTRPITRAAGANPVKGVGSWVHVYRHIKRRGLRVNGMDSRDGEKSEQTGAVCWLSAVSLYFRLISHLADLSKGIQTKMWVVFVVKVTIGSTSLLGDGSTGCSGSRLMLTLALDGMFSPTCLVNQLP